MPYCLKCGSKVEDTMTFCPDCGTQLKEAAPTQAPSAESSPKHENPASNAQQQPAASPKVMRYERTDFSFIRYLVGGLILVTVGVSAILELTNPAISSGNYLAIMLLAVGLILICGAVYYAFAGRKRVHSSVLEERTEKKPSQPAT